KADQRTQRAATQLLARELSRQLMADGGHIGRNPQTLVDLLLELLPLRQAYAARGTQMPAALLNAIDRMMPMLRLLRHGDGTLALFNGMSITQPELIATLLTYDDVRGRALLNAPYSGYQRMEARGSALIVDSGRPPPPAFSKEAHAGCLAFEFSSGGERLALSHDGYASRFGIVHARALTLSPDGARLSGEDSLLPTQQAGTAAHGFALRFHLHASVNAASIWDGKGVVLDMPSGERFTFDADFREVRVEDSVFFAAPNGPRNSRQIVIDGRIEGDVTIA